MGQRSRKRKRVAGGRAPAAATQGARPARERVSGEVRDARAREGLEPLAPGERPKAVTVSAIVAALLAVTNLALLASGSHIKGTKPSTGGAILFAGLMLAAAVGMWRSRYWAVLGFQALLGLAILVFALLLAVASNVLAVVLCLAVIVPGGFLFWKLIRAMGRIQMPTRRPI